MKQVQKNEGAELTTGSGCFSETDEEHTLRAIVEGVAAETGERFFASLVEHVAAALGVPYVFISELSPDHGTFRTRAVWGRGQRMENFEVPLAGTPCEAVLNGEASHYPDRLQQRFPEDVGLGTWGVESYGGIPLFDASGNVVGHVAIMDEKPMRDAARGLAILRIFAARAQAELERLRFEAALRESEERLSRIIESAMDAILTVDEQQRIILFNAAAERVFACSATEALGQPLARFLTDGFRRALDPSFAVLDDTSQPQPYVWAPEGLCARDAKGREFPIEGTISRAQVANRVLHTLILRNIDERRQAEEQLRHLHRHNQYLQEEIRAVHNVDEIVGESHALKNVLEQARLVAPTDSSVLILGETGTGKELIARSLHANSRRKDRPLIKVNCAALPIGLIESELFGHEKGAFTGAAERRIGRFELAHGGTLFLDEVGDIPPDVQTKLLRVLQEREVERIGGNKVIPVNVRLVAATNRDLGAAVANGSFREDLYYRLSVFPIAVPPLRARRDDIPALVHYFVARFAAKTGRRITRVPSTIMQRLVDYSWPGNVRELENVIERAVILSAGTDLHVAPELLLARTTLPAKSVPSPRTASPSAQPGDRVALDNIERDHIIAVLDRVSWRIEGSNGAAHLLGLRPSTLRSRMKKLQIERQPQVPIHQSRDRTSDSSPTQD